MASLFPTVTEAQAITEIVCIQNFYNVGQRTDDAFVDALPAQGVAYVAYFPLGWFSPLKRSKLNEVAASLDATPMQVALAWLVRRSPNMLPIPGTSSVQHLLKNLKAATLELPDEALTTLGSIGASTA
jgi:pyridoxine 4-dehydrogenase